MGKRRRLKLLLAYEGTAYAGWQRQKKAPTVQAALEEALHRITQEKVKIVGAGRTDSGVHAAGQVAHVALSSKLPVSSLKRAMNAVLPDDILVRSVRGVPNDFHARYSAKAKRYRYRIWNHPERPLLDRQFLLHVREPLHLSRMRRAARALTGRHDFRAFHSSGREVASTRRRLTLLRITKKGHCLTIDAQADGFLYHMGRRIAGLLIEIGKGKYPPAVAQEILQGTGRVIPPTAPARGLCLEKITY